MIKVTTKVYAYIVQDGDLVVFREPDFPEVGIQVPGGTVDEDEALDAAVLREAYEETNLEGLSIVRYLGYHRRDMRDFGKNVIHQRHFYELRCASPIPALWRHYELFSTTLPDQPILFELFRVPLSNPPKLIKELDIFIARLSHGGAPVGKS